MNYADFTKKLQLPENWEPPKQLTHKDIVARPLSREVLEADVEAINSSLDIIKQSRGGSWPGGRVEKDTDFLDLAWHECEFNLRKSFAYVVYDANDVYIGCFYLFPMGFRTILTEDTVKFDIDASWWVTQKAYDAGYYPILFTALQYWLNESFPFTNIYYSNREMPNE